MLQQMTRPERVLLFMKPIIKLPSFKFRPKSCQGKPIRDKKLMKRVSRGRVLQHLYLFLCYSWTIRRGLGCGV